MNNSLLLGVAIIGGLWWFSKTPQRNPVRKPQGSPEQQLEKAKRDLAKVRQRLDDWEEVANSKPTQAEQMRAISFLRNSTIYRREYTREYNLKKLIGRLSMSV